MTSKYAVQNMIKTPVKYLYFDQTYVNSKGRIFLMQPEGIVY